MCKSRATSAATDPHQIYTLLITVKERLVLSGVNVTGAKRVSPKTLHELIDLTPGKPLEPGDVTRAVDAHRFRVSGRRILSGEDRPRDDDGRREELDRVSYR